MSEYRDPRSPEDFAAARQRLEEKASAEKAAFMARMARFQAEIEANDAEDRRIYVDGQQNVIEERVAKASTGGLPDGINPAVNWLAYAPIKEIHDTRLRGITIEHRPDGHNLRPAVQGVLDTITDYSDRAARGLVRNALVGGAALGAFFGLGFVVAAGHSQYVAREHYGAVPSHVDGQLLPGNTLTAERWIPLGDTGVQIPDLRTLTYGQWRTTEHAVTEQHVASASTASELARNPVAKNGLQLTGKEYAIDLKTAAEIINKIQAEKGTITSAEVEGFASDEYNGDGLGVKNPEQLPLARSRADVAKTAIQDAAKESGVPLPDSILSVTSREAVTSQDGIARIDAIAAELGMTRPELLTMYDGGRLPKDTTGLLDALLPRGANYTVGYETTTTERTVTLDTKDAPNSLSVWFPAFLGTAMGLGLTSGILGATADSRLNLRRARHLARQDVKNANQK